MHRANGFPPPENPLLSILNAFQVQSAQLATADLQATFT